MAACSRITASRSRRRGRSYGGARHEVIELRSDGRENLVTAMAIAAGHLRGAPLVPEVTIFFDDVLLRGNRTVKVHADSSPASRHRTTLRWPLPASRSTSTPPSCARPELARSGAATASATP